MARYGVQTKAMPEKVVEMTVNFFGEGGLGLDLVERGPDCVTLKGGGGHVTVTATPGEGETEIELQTREWDRQVRQFVEKLSKAR